MMMMMMMMMMMHYRFVSALLMNILLTERQHKAILHQFSLKEKWLQNRGTVTETEEVFCRIYITEHSYVSIKTKVSTSAQEILKIVAEKLQHSQEDLALVALSFSGGKWFYQLFPVTFSLSVYYLQREFG
ncbi:hypothetical protein JD844_003033 [Phrynosoma platyrhinos]|uniref:Uncharacterized protein n=1 Tax=Phrynosoma platyrhinos TaxID=52577 RepID=A0ABQ7TCZ3_PHRPL|nr:hypothetical protein JD844_003033 [Phrynosoma platyrhinos]